MGGLLDKQFKADCPGLGALARNPMAYRLPGILRDQLFQLRLGTFMLEWAGGSADSVRANSAQALEVLISTLRTASTGSRRFHPKQPGRLAALDASPEFLLGRQQQVLVERIGRPSFRPSCRPGDDRQRRRPGCATHILCCSCAICFSAAASSENIQGSMNFASNMAPPGSTRPSRVAANIMDRVKHRRWTLHHRLPGVPSYQCRFRSSVTVPSWTIGPRTAPARPRPASPATAEPGGLVVAHDDPGIRAANKSPTIINEVRSKSSTIILYR